MWRSIGRLTAPRLGTLRSVADEAEWLDIEAAARYVGLSANTLYRLVREGKLLALRFPVRVRRQDLDAVTEVCRIRPGELAHLTGRAAKGSN